LAGLLCFYNRLFSQVENKIIADSKQRYARSSSGQHNIAGLAVSPHGAVVVLDLLQDKKQQENTRNLLLNLEHNNRKYVFDPGTESS
jgi:hypothetical protein